MKEIYELLNYVDTDFKEYDELELSDIEKKRFKNNLNCLIKKKKYRFIKVTKIAMLIFAAFILTAGMIFKTNPTFAREIPVLGSIIKNIESYKNNQFDTYTSILNKSVEKNSIKATLKEVVIDNNKLIIAAEFKSGTKLSKESFPTMLPDVYINGKKINTSGGKDKEIIDGNNYTTVDSLNISTIDIPENVDMEISYENFYIGKKEIKGPWKFKFKLSKKGITNKTRDIKVDRIIKWKDTDMNIEKIVATPISTNIYFDFNVEGYSDPMDCNPLYFIIKDDRGNYVRDKHSGSLMPNKNTVNYANEEHSSFWEFSGMGKNIKKLYVTPYYKKGTPKYTKAVKIENNMPIVLKQNSENKLLINSVQRENGKVYVNYKVEGNCFDIQLAKLYLYDCSNRRLNALYEGNSRIITNNQDTITSVFKDVDEGDIYVGTDDMGDITLLEQDKFVVEMK
ncbi:DUF4179 domain-containing protein [Clostridium sp.]|uniref:DUF4179 domain-containing protein n=1 Tax=Clostridium sp. TaxID=1506 RepID=UPI0035A191EC